MSTVPAHGQIPVIPPHVPVAAEIDYDKFVTEDDTPVDSIYSERQHRLLTESLFASWHAPDSQPHLAATDVGLFYAVNEPPVVPDVMISLGVAPNADWTEKKNRSYFVLVFGKAPDLVVEVVSNTEGGELSDKMRKYAKIGITYYVVWDPLRMPSKTPLQCFALERRKYVACKPTFPELGLGVTAWTGSYDGLQGDWLRWQDQQGVLLPTGIERADRLAEKLRSLGVDPDQA